MIELVSQELKLSVVIKAIVGEFGGSERQVWRDWGSRGKRIPGFVNLDHDGTNALISVIESLRMVKRTLFKSAFESPNSWVQVKGMKACTDTLNKGFKMLQSVGVIPGVCTRRR